MQVTIEHFDPVYVNRTGLRPGHCDAGMSPIPIAEPAGFLAPPGVASVRGAGSSRERRGAPPDGLGPRINRAAIVALPMVARIPAKKRRTQDVPEPPTN